MLNSASSGEGAEHLRSRDVGHNTRFDFAMLRYPAGAMSARINFYNERP